MPTHPAIYATHLRPRFLIHALTNSFGKQISLYSESNILLWAQHPLLRGWINFPKNLEAFSKFWGPKGWREEFPIWGPTVIRRRCTKFSHPGIFHPTKSDCVWPTSVFARFSICWLLFVLKSEIPLEGAPLGFEFGHLESREMYIKHNCKGNFYKGIQYLYDVQICVLIYKGSRSKTKQ